MYIRDGMAYIPSCRPIDNVTVLQQSLVEHACFNDVLVSYGNNNATGFLRHNNVISTHTGVFNCKTHRQAIRFNKTHVLLRSANNLTVAKLGVHEKPLRIVSGSHSGLFEHNEFLVNSSSIHATLVENYDPQQDMKTFYDPINDVRIQEDYNFENSNPVNTLGSLVSFLHKLFYLIICICVVIVFFQVLKFFNFCTCCCKELML